MVDAKILIIDDEPAIRFALRDFLELKKYRIEEAATCAEALEIFSKQRFDAVILDFVLPDGDAFELMDRIKELEPDVPVLVLTGHGSIDLAVQAIKNGAEQFLTKPVELSALALVLDRLVENKRIRQKQLVHKAQEKSGDINPFIGTSRAITQLRETAIRLAAVDRPVLIQGETGAGKGVLARWMHNNGPRSHEAYVDINCAGMSRELLESEIFGFDKGAFTGAAVAKKGLFEVADRGTVLLDEIGDISLDVQPKLLKVLEEMSFRRLGSVQDRTVDVRLIAATHRDLAAAVKENAFRADLFFRINALPIRMPPLRERAEDVPALADVFLTKLAVELGRPGVRLAESTVSKLSCYDWPGNIRELRNVLERAVLLGNDDEIMPADLSFDLDGRPGHSGPARLTLREMERDYIERVLGEEDHHVIEAAKRLGIPKSTLYQKIKDFGIKLSRNRN